MASYYFHCVAILNLHVAMYIANKENHGKTELQQIISLICYKSSAWYNGNAANDVATATLLL